MLGKISKMAIGLVAGFAALAVAGPASADHWRHHHHHHLFGWGAPYWSYNYPEGTLVNAPHPVYARPLYVKLKVHRAHRRPVYVYRPAAFVQPARPLFPLFGYPVVYPRPVYYYPY